MMKRIIIAGFGGQGIILSGMLLAYGAMSEGKEISHIPSYGAEMRGGTCNCSVVISDDPISSPIISQPDIALVFNQPSKIKFEPRCVKGATMLLNSSLITEKVNRDDINAYYADATNIADEIGNIKVANMVMLGALSKKTEIVKLNTLIEALPKLITARNSSLINLNIEALKRGYESVV